MTDWLTAVLLLQLGGIGEAQQQQQQPGQQLNAVCSLGIRGFEADRIGVANASLNCTSPSPLRVGVDAGLMSKFVHQFQGVEASADAYSCHRQVLYAANDVGDQLHALLHFCAGNYNVTFSQLSIQDVYLDLNDTYWSILAFGQQVVVNIVQGFVANNQARSALVFIDNAQAQLSHVKFLRNAGVMGTCILGLDKAQINVSNSSFTNNTAVSAAAGVGIDGEVKLHVSNSLFDSNLATQTGGAVGVTGQAVATLASTTIRNCSAPFSGGVYAAGFASVHVLKGSTFIGNFANAGEGGDIGAFESIRAVIHGAEFINNSALTFGAGVLKRGGRIDVFDSLFIGNTLVYTFPTPVAGAGLFAASKLSVTGCIFEYNSAVQGVSGGLHAACNNEANFIASIVNSSFSANQALNGGGLTYDNCPVSLLLNSTIDHNQAVTYGGGVYATGNTSLSLDKCSIVGNAASYSAGMSAQKTTAELCQQETCLPITRLAS